MKDLKGLGHSVVQMSVHMEAELTKMEHAVMHV
jgi:hypothetical protein